VFANHTKGELNELESNKRCGDLLVLHVNCNSSQKNDQREDGNAPEQDARQFRVSAEEAFLPRIVPVVLTGHRASMIAT
jgi:hypothetical protein